MEANLGFVSSDCLRHSRSRYHLYLLRDPDTNQVRYVGCCKSPKARYTAHIHSKVYRGQWIGRWIDSLLTAGKRPVMELVCCCVGKANARRIEKRMIRHWMEQVGFALCNQQWTTNFVSLDKFKKCAAKRAAEIRHERRMVRRYRVWKERQRRKYGLQCNGRWLMPREWAKELGISFQALKVRLKKWPQQRALTTPNLSRRKQTA